MFKKRMIMVLAIALALVVSVSACSPAAPAAPSNENPSSNTDHSPDQPVTPGSSGDITGAPLAPQIGAENMQRGNAFIDNVEILILESFPPQFNLLVEGNLPTPCHQLQSLINEPDAENRINVEIFSVVDPEVMCMQVLAPISETIALGSFPDGDYTILVNGQQAGEITSP